MPAQLFFRIDQFVVDTHLKRPFRACDQGERFDDVLIIFHQVGCRPDSSLDIVSRHTIFNEDGIHHKNTSFVELMTAGCAKQGAES